MAGPASPTSVPAGSTTGGTTTGWTPKRWVLACTVAETVGMTAAAAAARAATTLADDGVRHARLWGFALVLLGGLVEGTALGVLQGRVLSSRYGAGVARGWLAATVAVAGLGWAVGSAPSTLAGDEGGTAPPLLLVLAGAAGIGVGMGALLGAAQALVLRGRVRHPWRWVAGSCVGWTAAMTVIFAGAGSAGASWPVPVVVAYGAGTGALAGALLGLGTAPWLAALDGPPVRHRWVVAWLTRRRSAARSGITALAVTGRRSGRVHRFPVMAAALDTDGLVVMPGRPERKTWWRNLDPEAGLAVLDGGRWRPAHARVLRPDDPVWATAAAAYRTRWPKVEVTDGPLVVIAISSEGTDGDASIC